MRIIAGSLKGRRIPFNNRKYGNARVTSDFVKKAAFSILGETLAGRRFLDLFAGSGQIGLEAFSRGAEVAMNERDRRRCRFIADLIGAWGIREQVQLTSLPAERLIPRLEAAGATFDVIYLDPPYDRYLDDTPFALSMLHRIGATALSRGGGVVLVQHPSQLDLPASSGNLSILRRKTYGNTCLTLYGASESR